MEKIEQASGTCGTMLGGLTTGNMSLKKERKNGADKSEEIIANNFPYLVKDKKLQTPDVYQMQKTQTTRQNIAKSGFIKIPLFKRHH